MDLSGLKQFLLSGDERFWAELAQATASARDFQELFLLSSLRRKARARGLPDPRPKRPRKRLAIVGGYSLYPLHELVEHLCETERLDVELWKGDFDNYVAEIMEDESGLHAFRPHIVAILPSAHRCRYSGLLTDPRDSQEAEARRTASELLELTIRVNNRTGADVILANFPLPARHDLGSFRCRTMGADWTFRKRVNLELGLEAPSFVRICDVEFLGHRIGGLGAADARAWFESKQPGSPAMIAAIAREIAHLVGSLDRPPKKVLVLDLDNTLWGGVVADDGIEGIELGDTSPRGEAFKSFQRYVKSLANRGVLLGVCSKNDFDKAVEPFERHPEMALKTSDIVNFKANWDPKSDNLRRMAEELNLGLDSFVFVDDNPAEIEIVRQFTPQVTAILLGPDPAEYAAQLEDCRLFEPSSITTEDVERTKHYRSEAARKAAESSITDMGAYLESLAMRAKLSEFTAVDAPRISQLINKSNQFNLTTRRRSEAETLAVMTDVDAIGFTARLEDRFGDHGLISVVVARRDGSTMAIDTWLMSCRVLKRGVEEIVLDELVRLARSRGCDRLVGTYLPTPKNGMVRDFFTTMGFTLTYDSDERRDYELIVDSYHPQATTIEVTRRAYEPD